MRSPACAALLLLLTMALAPLAGAQSGRPCFGVFDSTGGVTSGIVFSDGVGNSRTPGADNSTRDLTTYGVSVSCTEDVLQGQAGPAVPPEPLTLTGVQVRWAESGDLLVTWSTNHDALGRLWWGPAAGQPIGKFEDAQFSMLHTAVIPGLERGHSYTVRVAAIDRQSAFVISDAVAVSNPLEPSKAFDLSTPLMVGLAAGAAVAAIRIQRTHRQ